MLKSEIEQFKGKRVRAKLFHWMEFIEEWGIIDKVGNKWVHINNENIPLSSFLSIEEIKDE